MMDIVHSAASCSQKSGPTAGPLHAGEPSTRQCYTDRSRLRRLEAESIHMIREVVADAAHPAMLLSLAKSSSVMLHLACKAFHPSPLPFPLLHIDSGWNFREAYQYRERLSKTPSIELLVHTNRMGVDRNINPFDHSESLYVDVMRTESLTQALEAFGFEVIFSEAQPGPATATAVSLLTYQPWNLLNAKRRPRTRVQILPLQNWSGLDLWQYIYQENIDVVSLHFAKQRPVVERTGRLIAVDDARFRLRDGEHVVDKLVRFEEVGCYPLTTAIESSAANPVAVIEELVSGGASHDL